MGSQFYSRDWDSQLPAAAARPMGPMEFQDSQISALLFGWMRTKFGSIIGPWLMHASGHVTMAQSIAIRTTG